MLKTNRKKHRLIDNVTDYIYVDDFYRALTTRDSIYYETRVGDIDYLYTQNAECLRLVKVALNNIDWTKYKF